MKKVLIIIGIVIVVLLAAVAATPFLFKGKILEIAKTEVNKMLTAEVDFNDDAFKVSIFKTFPNLSVQFGDLKIVGTGQFANDTLLSVRRLSATVDIMTLIKSQPIGIIDVTIEKPRIRALVAFDSAANYDIMKPSDEVAEEDTSSSSFAMKLNHIELVDAYIYYNDIPGSMTGIIDGLNTTITGDFTESSTLIQTLIDIQKLSFTMDGIPYTRDLHFNLNAGIEADFENEKYTLKDNKMSLNDLELAYYGLLDINGDYMNMDFTFKTMKTDFKNILSLVPGVFMEGFEDIKTSGKLALEGSAKGLFAAEPESYPAFNLALLVEDGSFQYPDLPKAVNNIQ
ncbi:MAG: AsmA family protein, partial [Bacteroidales bacterium]|nr:AsmA family protein [Bacteroidales bacterium]